MVYLRVSVPESPFWPLTFRVKFQPFFSIESPYLSTEIHIYFPFIGANFIIRPLAPFSSSEAADLMVCGCSFPGLLSALHTTLILALTQVVFISHHLPPKKPINVKCNLFEFFSYMSMFGQMLSMCISKPTRENV